MTLPRESDSDVPMFTAPRAFAAEGARVALTSCKKCGAALQVDPAFAAEGFENLERHAEWHREIEATLRAAFDAIGP